jgi:2-polyprenyl-6-methoxyphenol hydroxylase-like FAD-dependent oxidoreductase
MSSQELIEAILLDRVRATGMVDVRFATEATRLVRGGDPGDDSAALEVRSRATGARETLTGRALVAADGAASFLRGELGIEMDGAKELLHIVNATPRGRRVASRRPDGRAVLRRERARRTVPQPLDGRAAGCARSPSLPVVADVFTHERARAGSARRSGSTARSRGPVARPVEAERDRRRPVLQGRVSSRRRRAQPRRPAGSA